MAKKQNAFLAGIDAKHKAEMARMQLFVMQWCEDAAMIAANQVLGLGEGRAKEFGEAYNTIMAEIAEIVRDDGKDDKELVYAKAKVDDALKRVCGKHFQPWEERYGAI